MAQRISPAKQRIRDAGATFTMPPPDALEERLRAVLHVLYLIVNEGYTSSSGPEVDRPDLTREVIRLTREVHRLRPDDSEVAGLLALMLLTEACRCALRDSNQPRWQSPLSGLLHTTSRARGGLFTLLSPATPPLCAAAFPFPPMHPPAGK